MTFAVLGLVATIGYGCVIAGFDSGECVDATGPLGFADLIK